MKKSKAKLVWLFAILLIITGSLVYYWYLTDYRNTNFVDADPLEQSGGSNLSEEGDYRSQIATNDNLAYILFLGIDRNDERQETMGVFRTDTIAVARVDIDNKKIKVLSIPRDTYTYVPIENKLDKINHAYAYGSLKGKGAEESIKAVNNLLGKTLINYYFLMDMEPIPEIVDQIGGVTIDVDMNMKDSGIVISKGNQVLNGEQSRLYLRWRYSPGGDIDRIKHQQKFMLSLFKQQKEAGKLLESMQILLKYHDNVKTDLSIRQMIGLARFSAEVPGDSVEYYIIPGRPQMINSISYWVMDKNETQKVISEFLN